MTLTIPDILIALGLGFVFGWVLDKGGLNRYFKIANVFRFTDLTVLRFMMSGMLVGVVGIYGLKAFGLVDLTAVAATALVGNFVGGAVFGIGMAMAGFCPGTMVAGAARGQLDYLIPGGLGFVTGGLIFGVLYRSDLIQWLISTGRPELAYAKLPELLGVDPTLMAFVVAEGILIFLYVLAKLRLRRKDVLEPVVQQERIAAGLEQAAAPVLQGTGD
ncbi:MAG: YeeE/YedE family protein [Anaerolineae bacterium]|nr:YeeE/YedE family protein [Anaerolineae bacterium]